jgi:hypothetical protein
MATAIRATPATWWDSVADALRGRDRVAGGAGVVHGPARRALERRPYSFSGGFLSGRRGLEPATYGLEVRLDPSGWCALGAFARRIAR